MDVSTISEAAAPLREHLGFTVEGPERRVVSTHSEHPDLLRLG